MSTLVHAHVYDPRQPSIFGKAAANEAAELHTVTCTEPDRCELRKAGECAARSTLGGSRCIYGRCEREVGPTKRAKACGEWVRTKREQHANVGTLGFATRKLCRIGDCVWVPYPYMDEVMGGERATFRNQFVPVPEFTPELVARLAEARPRNMWGEPIASYQAETVPKFVAHLVERFPDIAAAASEISPRVKAILATITKAGRTAFVWTVVPNVGLLKDRANAAAAWAWDGAALTTTDKAAISVFTPFAPVSVSIVPGPDATVVLTSDAQADANTRFKD